MGCRRLESIFVAVPDSRRLESFFVAVPDNMLLRLSLGHKRFPCSSLNLQSPPIRLTLLQKPLPNPGKAVLQVFDAWQVGCGPVGCG